MSKIGSTYRKKKKVSNIFLYCESSFIIFIYAYAIELNVRLQELENQKFQLEEVRNERTKLNDECEQLKREI